MTYLDEADPLIHGLAVTTHRKYRSVAVDDLVQCGREWVLGHPKLVATWVEGEDEKAGWAKLSKALGRILNAAARREKAYLAGYHPDDEAYYNVSLIESILPAVFDDSVADAPPANERGEERSVNDPAITALWPVHLADVIRAWKKGSLTLDERHVLALRYSDHLPLAGVAHLLQTDIEGVEDLVRSGMGKLIDALGGPPEQGCSRNCPECGQGVAS